MKAITILGLVGLLIGGCTNADTNDGATASAALDNQTSSQCDGTMLAFEVDMLTDLKETLNPTFVQQYSVTIPGALTATALSGATRLQTVSDIRTTFTRDPETGETSVTAILGGINALGASQVARRIFDAMDVQQETVPDSPGVGAVKISKDRRFECSVLSWPGGVVTCNFHGLTGSSTTKSGSVCTE